MKLQSEAFAAVPAAFAYRRATDFDRLTALATGTGLTVTPLDRPELGEGPAWYISGKIGNMDIDLLVSIAESVENEQTSGVIVFKNIWFNARLRIHDLGPGRCRMSFDSIGEARGLKARFLLKSLKMAQGKLNEKLDTAMRKAATRLEAEHAKACQTH